MSDLLDMAAGIEAEHLARSLAGVSRVIPVGVAGECDQCGEHMARLVGGRCGFCRDGRVPPPSFFDRPAPVAPVQPPKESVVMANKPPSADHQTISVPASGRVLDAIRAHAAENDLPLGRAAIELLDASFDKSDEQMGDRADAAPAKPDGTILSVYDNDELFDELRARLDRAALAPDLTADLTEMTDRAIAAEAKIAAMKAALLG